MIARRKTLKTFVPITFKNSVFIHGKPKQDMGVIGNRTEDLKMPKPRKICLILGCSMSNKVKNCFLGKVTYFYSCTKVKFISSENIEMKYFFSVCPQALRYDKAYDAVVLDLLP